MMPTTTNGNFKPAFQVAPFPLLARGSHQPGIGLAQLSALSQGLSYGALSGTKLVPGAGGIQEAPASPAQP